MVNASVDQNETFVETPGVFSQNFSVLVRIIVFSAGDVDRIAVVLEEKQALIRESVKRVRGEGVLLSGGGDGLFKFRTGERIPLFISARARGKFALKVDGVNSSSLEDFRSAVSEELGLPPALLKIRITDAGVIDAEVTDTFARGVSSDFEAVLKSGSFLERLGSKKKLSVVKEVFVQRVP
jgi:hypothetical protein